MSSGMSMNGDAFGERIQKYLRTSGYFQKELAVALSLHPKVLSRKLHGYGNAHLTQQEIQYIVKTLVSWRVITTKDEALQLLALAQLGPTLFSQDDWQTPPLNLLATANTQPIDSRAPLVPTQTFQHNIPAQTTRLIGREWAVTRLRAQLGRADVRLITLIGSGGCGKTRLALQVASELVGAYAQGVWFVPLASVSDPALVPMSVIQAFNVKLSPDVSPMQRLITHVRDKQLLLILDNFEHVEGAAIVVDEMLAAAPGLKVLVTSRAVLHLYGEYEFGVPPLDVPTVNNALSAAQLSQFGAVQLFVERTQAVLPDFVLTKENGAAIAQICARVDGLPLALELAAAQMKTFPPALLLERLSKERLPILVGGPKNRSARQQTLHNTITWSYNLLSSEEQTWFARLGVFTDGWSLKAVEAMIPALAADQKQENSFASNSVLEMLEQLADHSLLVRLPASNEQLRFTMLETLREYARDQLITRGEYERLRNWHACYYMAVAEVAEIGLRGPQQLAWLAKLAADRNNFHAALEWSQQQARAGKSIPISFCEQKAVEVCKNGSEPSTSSEKTVADTEFPAVELCLRLVAALRPYWEWQGHLTEGRNWLRAMLAVPLAGDAGERVLAARAKALSEAARLACLQSNLVQAVELAEESIALWRKLNNPTGLAHALLHRGWAAHAANDYEGAKQVYVEGIQLLTPAGDLWLRAQLHFHLGDVLGFTGDFEQTWSCYAQSRELFEQVGDKTALADVLKDQGGILLLDSKYTEAIDCLLQSMRLCLELDHKQFMATGIGLLSFAFGLRALPDPRSASLHSAQLQGASETLMDTIGFTPWTRSHPLGQIARQHIRSQAGEQEWQDALNAGRALTVGQAIDLAYRLEKDIDANG